MIRLDTLDLNNKLFCTFSSIDTIDKTIEFINSSYCILYSKIFILQLMDNEELACTYNIDTTNTRGEYLIPNTILVHRKKEFNTLYTINSLKKVIEEENKGEYIPNYNLDWSKYRNTILLLQDNNLKKLETKIYNIINL